MKRIILLVMLGVFTLANANAQNRKIETASKPANADGEMKIYVMVILKAGPTRNQAKEKVEKIQKEHMDHLTRLAEDGFLIMAGPIKDEEDMKGILVLNTIEIEEAKQRVEEDPAIQAGRLKAEYHLWYTKSGAITLP